MREGDEIGEYNPPKWLIQRGWRQTITVAGGKCLYTLDKMPDGIDANMAMKNITENDAMVIQGCIERLIEKRSHDS